MHRAVAAFINEQTCQSCGDSTSAAVAQSRRLASAAGHEPCGGALSSTGCSENYSQQQPSGISCRQYRPLAGTIGSVMNPIVTFENYVSDTDVPGGRASASPQPRIRNRSCQLRPAVFPGLPQSCPPGWSAHPGRSGETRCDSRHCGSDGIATVDRADLTDSSDGLARTLHFPEIPFNLRQRFPQSTEF